MPPPDWRSSSSALLANVSDMWPGRAQGVRSHPQSLRMFVLDNSFKVKLRGEPQPEFSARVTSRTISKRSRGRMAWFSSCGQKKKNVQHVFFMVESSEGTVYGRQAIYTKSFVCVVHLSYFRKVYILIIRSNAMPWRNPPTTVGEVKVSLFATLWKWNEISPLKMDNHFHCILLNRAQLVRQWCRFKKPKQVQTVMGCH